MARDLALNVSVGIIAAILICVSRLPGERCVRALVARFVYHRAGVAVAIVVAGSNAGACSRWPSR